jgi:bifunctional DNA-binding transcriptional regulator/antitoxin component of YhaV-PrlF toxin-antitoxin module
VSDLVVVIADQAGATVVSPQGHLRLPAALRQRCGLVAGTQLLLVADPPLRRLVIHPQASVEAMVAARYAEVFGGEA